MPFNPFSENTYIVWDSSGECIIIDPGCYNSEEENQLAEFIDANALKPVSLLNTHCHIDHVLGNHFVSKKYNLQAELHLEEIPLLHAVQEYAGMYGIQCKPTPEPFALLNESKVIRFGQSTLAILHTPGHSPGSLCFYSKDDRKIISGDVLFRLSIGRTDLPGGDYETLINSILNKLLTLPQDTVVYPGHGPETTIGFELRNNPFLNN